MNLNDDCLLEVFKYLNLQDLCSVADVCGRFRQNARLQFAHSAFTHLGFRNDFLQLTEKDNKRSMQITSRLLWNFGAYTKSIYNVNGDGDCDSVCRSKYHIRNFELISLHCSESLVELDLFKYNVTDAIAIIMRPVFARLETLTLRQCRFSDSFLNVLPIWAPELRDLRFLHINKQIRFYGLRETYRKLTKLTFVNVDYVNNEDFDGFLMLTPRLKQIEMLSCRNIDDEILQSIVVHVPQIEAVRFSNCRASNVSRVQCFNQLFNLRSLELNRSTLLKESAIYFISIANEIDAAQIPIRHLKLSNFDCFDRNGEFVDAISKLRNLETLKIVGVVGLGAQDICKICKSLNELRKIELVGNGHKMDAYDLVDLIWYSEKLKLLRYMDGCVRNSGQKNHIDADTYIQFVQTIQKRQERDHLVIMLSNSQYTVDLPAELRKQYNHLLALIVR